ncbi:MAG: tetratricopeptide repeat protein, partial [Gemmataceae bacterium]
LRPLADQLYSRLTESVFRATGTPPPATEFNYEYLEQVAQAILAQPGTTDTPRAMANLRMAATGLPDRAPQIFAQLSTLALQQGSVVEAAGYDEQLQRAVGQLGVNRLSPEQKPLYIAALQRIVATATTANDIPKAILTQRAILETGTNELESFRIMADLYERSKDPLNALLMTETGLVYSKNDADLLARKDRYYFSVEPDRLRTVKNRVESYFDTEYCLKKAKQCLDQRDSTLELLEWATHLAKLAQVMAPTRNLVRLTTARCDLRLGQLDAALETLEDLREAKRGSGDEEEAWFVGVKLLAEEYLRRERPDLAVACFLDYREYSRSGADTLFQIAKCYDQQGQTAKARQFYESVTAYEEHPRYHDAKDALRRLGA